MTLTSKHADFQEARSATRRCGVGLRALSVPGCASISWSRFGVVVSLEAPLGPKNLNAVWGRHRFLGLGLAGCSPAPSLLWCAECPEPHGVFNGPVALLFFRRPAKCRATLDCRPWLGAVPQHALSWSRLTHP